MSSGFKFTEVNGDLFNAPKEYALAINVPVDEHSQIKMTDSIAIRMRNKFSQVYCLNGKISQAGALITLEYEGRTIYYLVNKDPMHGDSLVMLERCLLKMREHMLVNGVRKVTMPRIATMGAGIHDWSVVRDLLIKTFQKDPVELLCYNYNPGYTSA